MHEVLECVPFRSVELREAHSCKCRLQSAQALSGPDGGRRLYPLSGGSRKAVAEVKEYGSRSGRCLYLELLCAECVAGGNCSRHSARPVRGIWAGIRQPIRLLRDHSGAPLFLVREAALNLRRGSEHRSTAWATMNRYHSAIFGGHAEDRKIR